MVYGVKNFDKLIGIDGFSEQLLKNHFTLYQGYVNNTNKSIDILKNLKSEDAELKRRFGWEFNGMRLHELYFGNLVKGGEDLDKNSNLFKKIVEDFGSYEEWEKDFKSIASMRGIGWVVLCYDNGGRLFNVWINEHDVGYLVGCVPLLVIDVFEHAFMIDYGLKKGDYIDAFFKAIDWGVVSDRLK